MNYDAVVIGAGPAGARAAWMLARAGRRVAMVERHPMPRDKVCGGALSGKALRLLGKSVEPLVHDHTRAADLMYGLAPFAAHEETTPIAAMVVRREFDAWLHGMAVAAGAIPVTATARGVAQHDDHVLLDTTAGPLRGAFALAADGATSLLRRQVFGRQAVRLSPALETLVPADDTVLRRFAGRATFDLGALPGGYGWIFPKRDHLNVGVYAAYRHDRLPAHLQAFIAGHPDIPDARTGRPMGHPIPTANVAGRYQHHRVWLLGDAAGLPEPLLGEGIHFALRSGELAAQVLLEHGDGAHAGAFDAAIKRQMVPDLEAAERLARVLYRLPGVVMRRLFREPRARRLVVRLISGDTSYAEAGERLTGWMPGWLGRLV